MGESPPHMRGKARHCAAVHGYRGITPAHAGKSFTSFYHCTTFWDHPRTCGEKLIPPLLGFGLTGSPPHMRGKERGSTSRQRRKGITPAHAGKSPAMSPGHITLRDHPRTCGEKGISDFSGNYEDGSPPHMRGKARSPLLFPGISRITPAHAGKSTFSRFWTSNVEDHPRTCGEKCFLGKRLADGPGSPPHMRGKAVYSSPVSLLTRITPAHAGKSVLYRYNWVNDRDHPRTCGEKQQGKAVTVHQVGSPPHMRGKGLPRASEGFCTRITPAHAGKRLKRSRSIVPHAAIVPLFPSVCNKPAGSDGSPAGHDAPPFLPIENAAPASPAYNLRSL